MQTLYTIEDKESGGVKTLLHVSSYTNGILAVVIYTSDEFGNHKSTVRKTFTDKIDILYHKTLRDMIKKEGGIIHKRISDTPLPKTVQNESTYPGRDSRGKFCKLKKK
jgi:hypothetical protein